MKKQTLILTGWLSMPFVCLTILMVWIFTSLDKERLMDEPPVGAGAGDTGNANALGQYLAGRDPDAVSNANQARRERHPIDPREWPGGVVLKIPMELVGDEPGPFAFIISKPDVGELEFVTVNVDPNADQQYELPLTHDQIVGGGFGVLQGEVIQLESVVKVHLPMTIPPSGVQSSDPIPVLVREFPTIP